MIKHWILVAGLIAIFTVTIYGAGQQILRQDANDPQIQVAEDLANNLSSGQLTPQTAAVSNNKIDISKSLALFLIIYDNSKNVASSTAILDGQTPILPPGILENVNQWGEERLTWQPQNNVRIATIVKKYSNGYVLVGRNLREVEIREHNLMLKVAGAGLLALVFSTIMLFFLKKKRVR